MCQDGKSGNFLIYTARSLAYYVVMRPSRDISSYVKSLLSKNPVILDTETTGLYREDVIVEIAVVDVEGNVILDTLINPSRPIAPEATRVHGITTEELQDAPTFDIVWKRTLEALFRRRIVCAYNVDFDIRMIRQTLKMYGMSLPGSLKTECIMKLFAELRGEWDPRRNRYRWFKLKEAAEFLGITIDGTLHRALADAVLAKEILLKMSLGVGFT